jgi:ribonuclease HI
MSLHSKSILTDHWIIYCDGSCALTNPGPCAWGAVLVDPTGREREYSGFIQEMGTNNIAELTAAISALSRTPVGCRVTLYSDSEYVIKGLSEWIKGWMRRGWVNSSGKPVANQPLWLALKTAYDARQVSLNWVRGHNNNRQNERADWLANKVLLDRRNAGIAEPGVTEGPAVEGGHIDSVTDDVNALKLKKPVQNLEQAFLQVLTTNQRLSTHATKDINPSDSQEPFSHPVNESVGHLNDTDMPLNSINECLLVLFGRLYALNPDDPLLERVRICIHHEIARLNEHLLQ